MPKRKSPRGSSARRQKMEDRVAEIVTIVVGSVLATVILTLVLHL